ncbi:MAG: CDP-diacylglycerol--serine O-phosphatidyltransferase, partial [Xanthobacteraceae bacterium]|nr:CDP-diacylglycerol--serine O-phosphatidyltransferase [Xanthobacteraceae bacterium]
MIFAISGGLRLARFNATMDDPNKPAFAANFFTGVPAPAGAICVLLPMYLVLVGLPQLPAMITALFTLVIAFLMVSRLPVFSGKMVGGRVPPDMVVPVVVCVVLFIAVLISYPWHLLSVGSLIYLICLPLGWRSYRDNERRAAAQMAAAGSGMAAAPAPYAPVPPGETSPDERPPRLN